MKRLKGLTVLRSRDFRLLFASQALAQVGAQAVFVAMTLYITERTGSPTDLAVVLGAGMLPTVLLILFGGVWADRLPRNLIVVGTDTIRMVLHLLLGLLILLGAPPIWLIAVIEALFSAATAFFQPAFTGLIPQTVAENQIGQAQALRGALQNLAIILGPILATVLVLTVGAGPMFLIDALGFLVSALLMTQIRPRERTSAAGVGVGPRLPGLADPGTVAETDRPAADESFTDELRAGFREVRMRGWVWGTILAFSTVLLLADVPWMVLGPVVTHHIYGSLSYYGVQIALYGAGALFGSLLATVWQPRYPIRLGLIFGVVWSLLGLALALGIPRWTLDVDCVITGAAGACMEAWWEASLARHIPPEALSRVSAWDWMGSLALMPLGYAIVGPVAAVVGERRLLGAGAIFGAIIAASALLAPGAWSLPALPPASEPAAADTA